MIEDLAQSVGDRTIRPDVCVIGGGPTGITVALELERSGLSVCLIEGGGLDLENTSQALYDGDEVGAPTGLSAGRLRQFGGSSNHWGGRVGRLDALDFARRDWVPHSGWPIDGETLSRYYDRALSICGFEEPWPSDAATIKALPAGFPRIGSPWLKPYVWRFTFPTSETVGLRFGVTYRPVIQRSKSVHAFLHANFIRVEMSANGDSVKAARFRSLGGRELRVEAHNYVLGAGGAENPRLLLIGDGRRSIGNGAGLVGRFFSQHLRCTAGVLYPTTDGARLPEFMNWDVSEHQRRLDRRAPRAQIGLAITDKAMRERRLLNASLWLTFTNRPHPHASGGLSHDIVRSSRALLAELGYELQNADDRLHERPPTPIAADLWIDIEQEPASENRLTLTDKRDVLGLPRSRVEWRLSERERETARAVATAAAVEFTRLGLGRVKLERWAANPQVPLETALYPTFHFSGATRMADNPKDGVVDANCKVHGVANLYVAGSSVFPAFGHINPTFTIVALAARLADRIAAGVTA